MPVAKRKSDMRDSIPGKSGSRTVRTGATPWDIAIVFSRRMARPVSRRRRSARYRGLSVPERERVYYRLTDDWLKLTVRFLVRDHGIRDVKGAMSRNILAGLDRA